MPDLNVFSLEGKTALIAGASRGIGLAIAQHIARAGARTILASRSMEKLEANARALREDGCAAEARECDIADQASIDRLIKTLPGGRHSDKRIRNQCPQALRGVYAGRI